MTASGVKYSYWSAPGNCCQSILIEPWQHSTNIDWNLDRARSCSNGNSSKSKRCCVWAGVTRPLRAPQISEPARRVVCTNADCRICSEMSEERKFREGIRTSPHSKGYDPLKPDSSIDSNPLLTPSHWLCLARRYCEHHRRGIVARRLNRHWRRNIHQRRFSWHM